MYGVCPLKSTDASVDDNETFGRGEVGGPIQVEKRVAALRPILGREVDDGEAEARRPGIDLAKPLLHQGAP